MEELHAVFMQVMAKKRADALAIPLKVTGAAESDSLRDIERESYRRHLDAERAERAAINNSMGHAPKLMNAPAQGVQPLQATAPTPVYMQGEQVNK